ncbi:hypothetical protein MN116_004900 [Schistosoma mekongi]|uniref:Bromodomain-containing protein 8 n=1 Tax=Schistosoma mekongi TaxID=38744 RepID=A0AAE2D504_SCHME|nr:hypothetical protein MN116_004900 [Schistosoma mekongi]
MNKDPLTPVPSERLLGPGYGQGVWPLRERLALATALLDVDNQQGSWAATSRRMMCFSRPGRPSTWCSSKACAKQYALLLDSIELVKRQKIPGCDTQTSQLSLAERVVKRLSAERAEELRSRIRLGQLYYTSLKNVISEVESGIYDNQLMNLLSVINPITDCKKKSENLDGESIQTTVLVNDDPSERQTVVANDITNASQSKHCNRYSDKSTAASDSFDNNQSCTKSFIGLWKEIQEFYHIPDSTWYCAPGPINNRISTSAYSGVTSRSRQSAGVGSLNFSRLSTLLAEASSPSLKPATQFRNSTNKSSSYKPGLHETSHTTAASRAAEAAKQRYLSKKGKGKFASHKSQLDRNYKTMKQHNKSKNWSKNISRNSLYDCTATSSSSKADRIKRAINRKSQLFDSRSSYQKSCISVYGKSVFEQELSDNETDLDNDDSMYEESSTDKQTDTPSSTPSTIAMCISDVEDFLIQDDEKSDKTIPNDDNTTYSTLDNDRPATTIPEDDSNDYNSESEKSISSDAVSSLSTEAVRETDSRVGDRNSSVCSSPTLGNITDGPEIAAEEEFRLDSINQKSPVVASSNMNLSTNGTLDVTNDNPENGMKLQTITDTHCSPVLSVDIQIPVENLPGLGPTDFVDTDSKVSHCVTSISNVSESSNVRLFASDVEKALDKKLDLSSNSSAQAKKVNKSVLKNVPTYSILPFLVKTDINKSPQTNTSDAESNIEVEHTEKSDMNVFDHEFYKLSLQINKLSVKNI